MVQYRDILGIWGINVIKDPLHNDIYTDRGGVGCPELRALF